MELPPDLSSYGSKIYYRHRWQEFIYHEIEVKKLSQNKNGRAEEIRLCRFSIRTTSYMQDMRQTILLFGQQI
jgi:hypothetical protein